MHSLSDGGLYVNAYFVKSEASYLRLVSGS
jgi:hypothetical protein